MGQCLKKACLGPNKDEVSVWLQENDLGQYSSKFSENGWDELSLLLEMSDDQIKKCIPKPGHIIKFKRALEMLMPDRTPRTDSMARGREDSREVPLGPNEEASTSRAYEYDEPPVKASYEHRLGNQMKYDAIDKHSASSEDEFFSIKSHFTARLSSEDETNEARTKSANKRVTEFLEDEDNEWRNKYSYKTTMQAIEDDVHSLVNSESIEDGATRSSADKESVHLSDTSLSDTDQNEKIAEWYERKNHLYVETSAYDEFKIILDEIHWVTVLGKPGDGKSAMAAHLMLKYGEQGFKPSFLTSPQGWKTLFLKMNTEFADTKQFIIVDDIFGNSFVDKQKVSEWLPLIEEMEQTVIKRKGDVLIVCTSRKYIFTEVEAELDKFKMFGNKLFIVDMTDEYQLSAEEKEKIFSSFAVEYNVSGCNPGAFKALHPPHGFPHCVELFCADSFFRQYGVAFFENPIQYIKNEIYSFKDNNCVEYIILLFVLINNNHLEIDYFDMLMEGSEHEKRILKDFGITLDRLKSDAPNSLKVLTNTYLTLGPGAFYCFSHEFLAQILAFVYFSVNPSDAIEVLEFSYVLAFVNVGRLSTNLTLEESLRVSNNLPAGCAKALAKRITSELKHGNMTVVGYCDVWRNQSFVSEWMKYVTSGSNSNLSNAGPTPLVISEDIITTL